MKLFSLSAWPLVADYQQISQFLGPEYVRRYHWLMAVVLLSSLLESVMILLVPIFAGLLFDVARESPFLQLIPDWILSFEFLAISFVLILSLRLLLLIYARSRNCQLSAQIYNDCSSELNMGLLRLRYLSFGSLNKNNCVKQTLTSTKEAVTGIERCFQLQQQLALVVVLCCTLLIYNPLNFLVIVLLGGIFAIAIRHNKNTQYQLGDQTLSSFQKLHAVVSDSYRSFRELKFNDSLGFHEQGMRRAMDIFTKNMAQLELRPSLPGYYIESSLYLIFILGMAYVHMAMGDSVLEYIPLAAFYLFMARRILPATNDAMRIYLEFRGMQPYLEEISALRDFIRDNAEAPELEQSGVEVMPGEGEPHDLELCELKPRKLKSIQFSNLRFSYNANKTDEKPTLTNIDFEIETGQKIALFGESGSGKTTLVEILASLITADSGNVVINGASDVNRTLADGLRSGDLANYRDRIGFVPQLVYLSDASIAENISLSEEQIDQARLDRCLAATDAKAFVEELPEGADSRIGDQGNQLSGGQCQRIALARALYHEPDLLILDEATSALDAATETRVIGNLSSYYPNMMVVFATHRTEAAFQFDQVIVLNKGEIDFRGTYANYQKYAAD